MSPRELRDVPRGNLIAAHGDDVTAARFDALLVREDVSLGVAERNDERR
jgi:hypothetical protein